MCRMSSRRSLKAAEVVVSLRIPKQLDAKVRGAAAKTHLKRSDVLRMAVDRGVDRLLEQLSGETAA